MLKISWIKFILLLSVVVASIASAEIYTWEDADAVNFTDNPSSVPDTYRNMVTAESREQIKDLAPQVRVEVIKHNSTVHTQKDQTAAYQTTVEQQNRTAATIKQPQTTASAESPRGVKDTFPSLATLIVVWLIIALFLIIAWVATIADTVRSRFITPSIRTAWMLLVIFVPVIGMLFYYILGLSQKCTATSCSTKQHLEALARCNIRESRGNDLVT
jgi:uncharacterized membrane protein YhaH (DUF805 family)